MTFTLSVTKFTAIVQVHHVDARIWWTGQGGSGKGQRYAPSLQQWNSEGIKDLGAGGSLMELLFRTGFRRVTVKEETASAHDLELAIAGGARKKIPTMCIVAQLHFIHHGGRDSLLSLEQ